MKLRMDNCEVIAETFPIALVKLSKAHSHHTDKDPDTCLYLQTGSGNFLIGRYDSSGKFYPKDNRHLWRDVGGQEIINKFGEIVRSKQ